jgi:hypothetical protein
VHSRATMLYEVGLDQLFGCRCVVRFVFAHVDVGVVVTQEAVQRHSRVPEDLVTKGQNQIPRSSTMRSEGRASCSFCPRLA